MSDIGGFIAFVAIFGLLASGLQNIISSVMDYRLDGAAWTCTASEVVKEALPRIEECTQYTKKEKKP